MYITKPFLNGDVIQQLFTTLQKVEKNFVFLSFRNTVTFHCWESRIKYLLHEPFNLFLSSSITARNERKSEIKNMSDIIILLNDLSVKLFKLEFKLVKYSNGSVKSKNALNFRKGFATCSYKLSVPCRAACYLMFKIKKFFLSQNLFF